MKMYIDIHTHSTKKPTGGNLVVRSLYEGFKLAGEGLVCSIGVHPWYTEDYKQKLELLSKFAELDNVLAIGECGLDKVCSTDWQLQLELFKLQIQIANRVGKPLIIHCVRAFDQLIQVFDRVVPKVPVIIHGFNKRPGVAVRLLERGYYLSFGAAILSASSPATELLGSISSDRFFLETDDVDVMIEEVYAQAAEIRKTGVDVLNLQLQNNFKKVLNL